MDLFVYVCVCMCTCIRTININVSHMIIIISIILSFKLSYFCHYKKVKEAEDYSCYKNYFNLYYL